MALLKKCSRQGCNKILDDGVKYCDRHQIEFEKEQKKRNKEYRQNREDGRENKFYSTDNWIRLRDTARVRFKGLCLICYFKDKIEPLYTIHHIVEVKEDWDCRLDIDNLIAVCQHHHRKIHDEYDKSYKDKKKMQKILFSLLEKFEDELG